jgi:hypothetical protein
MNLKRVIDVYEVIKNRLPKTFPRAKLAFYETEQCMIDNADITKEEDETVEAVVMPDTETIGLPMNITIECEDKNGETVSKVVPITKQTDEELAFLLLHESGHLVMGQRYGYSSPQYNDEKKCDAFARRWLKVLKKEKLI